MEILPNLHWIKGFASNVYLWLGQDSLIVVDSGMSWDAGRIHRYIRALGRQPEDVSAIFITHADVDHAGGAAKLQAECGAPVYAGAATASLLSEGRPPKHMPGFIQFVNDTLLRYRPVPADQIVILDDGETVPGYEEWQILATPGHSPDHHAFYSAVHGVVFAGDVMDNRNGRLQLKPDYISSDPAAVRKSALNLLRRVPAFVATGHGRPRQHDAEALMMMLGQLQADGVM